MSSLVAVVSLISCAKGSVIIDDGEGGATGAGGAAQTGPSSGHGNAAASAVTSGAATSTGSAASGATSSSSAASAASSSASGGPVCGDTLCDPTETCMTCPGDCTCPPTCGDALCDPTETCMTCPGDCGKCPSNCSHPICQDVGGPLNPTCDPCVSMVCSQDPYCCVFDWDVSCVDEVTLYCGQSCP